MGIVPELQEVTTCALVITRVDSWLPQTLKTLVVLHMNLFFCLPFVISLMTEQKQSSTQESFITSISVRSYPTDLQMSHL